MRVFLPVVSVLMILILASLSGCGGNAGEGNAAANANADSRKAANAAKANTNAEELGLLINFAWETEDLAWKKDDAKKTLVAAFRLSPEDARKLSEQLAAKGQGTPKEVAVEDWFPAELVAQGESTGNSSVPATAFPSDDLHQPPYTQGTISRVNDTDYFVIEMMAK